MSDLATRKRLLLAETELHRQMLTLERVQWGERQHVARRFIAGNRHWLLLAAAVAGVLVVRRWRTVLPLVPTVVAAWRAWPR